MTGQWYIVTGQIYPIPTIQVAPSSVIPFGGSFNITCNVRNERNSKRFGYWIPKFKFTLYKEKAKLIMVKAQNVSVYFKHNAKPPDGGSYTCVYWHPANCSERYSFDSNTVDVIIRDKSLWKPSISILGVPFVNGSAVIQCEGMKNDLNITLQRFSNPISVIETNTSTAEFLFSPLKVEDGGRYTCEYRQRGNRFVLSMTSDPLELNLTDSSLPKPTLKLRPEESTTLGWSVTIECQGPESGLNFALQQPSNSISLWLMESTRNSTEFSLAQVSLEDGGNYTCRYHRRDNPFVWSEPSEPVLLVVRALPTAEVSVRLTVAILVLLATLLIAAEAVYSSKKEAASRSPPE
ncbi:hypothetical protein lerEdw1_006973 [Lerista edwardsae]|nr:hypothetical protein lerEdw1_006973 [Lerista edwardsae]